MKIITKKFKNYDVRIVEIDNETWYVAKDICKILDYKNVHSALFTNCDSSENNKRIIRTPDKSGIERRTVILSRLNVDRMIEHTTKPAAVKLGQWLNNEIPQPDKSELETLRNENAELKKQIDNLQKFSNELAKMLKRLAEIAETI